MLKWYCFDRFLCLPLPSEVTSFQKEMKVYMEISKISKNLTLIFPGEMVIADVSKVDFAFIQEKVHCALED